MRMGNRKCLNRGLWPLPFKYTYIFSRLWTTLISLVLWGVLNWPVCFKFCQKDTVVLIEVLISSAGLQPCYSWIALHDSQMTGGTYGRVLQNMTPSEWKWQTHSTTLPENLWICRKGKKIWCWKMSPTPGSVSVQFATGRMQCRIEWRSWAKVGWVSADMSSRKIKSDAIKNNIA